MGNIYVTGADGFIGTHLMKALPEAIAVDPPKAYCCTSDDTVIHLANWVPDKFGTYLANVSSMGGMLTKSAPGGKIIYVSSSVVYADKPSLYRASKLACEELCKCYEDKLRISIIRPYNVYGPGQPDRFVIPTIINQFLDGKDMIVVKNVMASRVFTYVDDIIGALVNICADGYTPCMDGYEANIGHLIALIADIMDRTGQYKICTENTNEDEGPGTMSVSMNGTPLREGLEKTIEYYKQLRLEKQAV